MGGEPLYYLSQPKGILMRISDQVKRCVGFVGIRTPSGVQWGGTAFFVSLNETCSLHGDATFERKFSYMVTAKHVADKLNGSDWVVRINNREGRSVEFEATGIKWWDHPTESATVDSVVTPFAFQKALDVATISDSLFATPELLEEYEIGVGDEVYVAGLFSKITDTGKNQPVVRTGHFAMMPNEKIPFAQLGMIEAYLIEMKSFGGLSGCPVFVRHTVSLPLTDEPNSSPVGRFKRLYGGGSSYLLGSMIGHWMVPDESDPALKEALNLGLAAVVPTYKIIEVLRHPELVLMRKAEMEVEKKKVLSGSVLDTAFAKSDVQKTPEGLEIPVPTEDHFLSDLKKASRKKQ